MKIRTAVLACALTLSAPTLFAEKCVCSLEETSKAFTALAKKATPAVVFIKVELGMGGGDDPFAPDNSPYGNPFGGDDLFFRFFNPYGRPPIPQPQLSQGSGFLISSDGHIMTNAHVVKGADKIEVTLNDGQVLPATLVGADPQTDIALIKIEGKDYPFLSLGNSDDLEIGEWVAAIGNPFQLSASLTVGVVSAKGRQGLKIADYEDFIQTDAAINPGNSGGPLLTLNGDVIGINTAIFSRSGGYMGIGFAIPSNMAKAVMDQLLSKGSVTRSFIGVSLQPVDKDIAAGFNLDKVEGILISDVSKDSPAEKAGLKQGDIILEYNDKPIRSFQTFRNDVAMMSPGSVLNLKVNRKGKILKIPVTLGTMNDASSPNAMNQKLGIEIENLTPEVGKQLGYTRGEEGVVITKVKPGSTAAAAGLRPGFLILAVNHNKVTTVDEYNTYAAEALKNHRLLLLVRQGNMTRFYSIRIE